MPALIGFVMLLAATLFIALNVCTAILAAASLVATITFRLKRNHDLWLWLVTTSLLLASLGALIGSWGLGYVTAKLFWPEWGWSVIAWIIGFIVGAAFGVLLALAIVSRRKWKDIQRFQGSIKDFFYTTKNELSELPR